MSQSLPTRYEYQSLLEPDSIRVLQLHPASDLTSSPQCDLIGMRLCDSNEPDNSYTAISYDWGNERDSHSISIGSSELTVGKNIHSALRHIRRRDRPIRLWVDAICINQSDLTERNHQVQQMCAICSAAKETVIYLGDQDGGNTGISAWNFLERNSEWAMNRDHDEDYTVPARMEQKLEFRGDLDDVEIDVLERPCISRSGKIDVVRDMFHARCGYQDAHGMGDLRPSWHAKVENYKGGDSSILNTLSRARQQEAFDPRDKIYALLGVSTGVDLSGELIAVNYRKPCSQVYLDFARHIMQTTQSYDVLGYLDDYTVGNRHKLRSSRLPSSHDRAFWPRSWLAPVPQDYVLTESELQQSIKEYLPSWVPNWDRGAWNIPSPWKFRHTGRTVLSTLRPETEIQTALREAMESRSRIWTSTKALAAVGGIIGEVVERGPSIALLGNDELRFQDIRDRWRDDPSKLTEEILGQWQNILNQGELTLQLGNALERRHPDDLPNIARLLNSQPKTPQDSLECHLLARGRKSVAWNDDNNKAVAVVRDKGSIVESKRVAVYQRFNDREEVESEGLALLPSRTVANSDRSKYLIVYLRGARTPFLIHQNASSVDLEDKRKVREGLNSTFQLENCTMFGECLVNGFDDIVKDCEAILEESEASEETESGESPPAWTPFSHARVFLIS
ncbi:hypothetical protein DL98DRAFT_607686 [Cadophora sp. DSE1049]|nr:hypothetical protein DL98DRAFT_607686 [Cadophora sp. DSE1049]